MEDLILIFPHIAQKIFEHLDNESLALCREVAISWQDFIDDKNLSWIRIVNIPTVLQDDDTYLHVAARTGHKKMFEIIFENEGVKNPQNSIGVTPFHESCEYGHIKIAKLIIQKSKECNIDLNNQDKYGRTAFHKACHPYDIGCWCSDSQNSQFQMVEFLIQKSKEFEIDLNATDVIEGFFLTGFHLACLNGNSKIVEMMILKSIEFNIDLNAYDYDGKTAFHEACSKSNFEIVDLIIKKSIEFKIDLNARDDMEKTPFHRACETQCPHILNSAFTMCESCNERSLKTVELIIDNSSEFNIKLNSMDYHRNTPLDGAKNCGNLEIVEVLKQIL